MSATAGEAIRAQCATGLTALGLERPWLTVAAWVTVAVAFGTALLWAKIDTNPRNILPPDWEVRVSNDEVNERFGLHEDTIVVAIRPEGGVLTPEGLQKLHRFSGDILAL